jgi:hypothetical protein
MADTERERVVELIRKSPANHEYFFEKLDDPAWLSVLAGAGFFREPPEPERGDDWIRFPGWSESRYLVRVAARAPTEVTKLAAQIPATDNVRVHENMHQIAARLPGKMAARLARKEADWLRGYSGHLMSLPEASSDLIAHLAREGEARAAFELARTLLAIVPGEEPTSSRRRAAARMSEYSYGRIIERAWPALMEDEPARAFGFLCDRLADVVRIGFIEPSDGHDLTYVWRPAIEDHAQNLGHSLLDTLVEAVRDRALEAPQTPAALNLVLAELEKRPGPVFRRIALHIVRQRGPAEIVASALADPELARNTEVWHEYGELLRQRFAGLAPDQRDAVLEVIARGPGLALTPADEERGGTATYLARREAWWRLQRYTLIAEHLDGEPRRVYEALRAEHGEPEHPTFLSHTRSWSGPTSPYSSNELREMGPRGVVSALREWAPPGGPESPSPEGLGRILEQAVAADAAHFAAAAAEFTELAATYVRALLGGLAVAAKAGTPFPWDRVLELCEWVVAQPRSDADADGDWDRDPHWGWARKQIAGLLSQGFAAGPAQISQAKRERVWSLLEVLAEDPDPTPEHEERFGGDNMDPATLSINTTRGEAMHAVVRYALWTERALIESGRFAGMASLPEVEDLLERHVDVAVDPSLGVRSVYGQWFPQFVRIDKEWAAQLAPRVFPTAAELGAHFHAAWDTYIAFNRPFTDVFEVLREPYAVAVERLGRGSGRTPFAGDPRERLGDHLLTYRIVGATSGGGEDLFAAFWRAAPPDLRRQVLTDVGWSLEKTPELEVEVRERLVATWDWIHDEASGGETAPLAGFGAWFATAALDGAWVLAQARSVLELDVHLEPDFVVYRALPRLAPEHPREVVDVLRRMVLTDAEGWSLHGSTDEVREVLRMALTADNPDTRARAEALVHLLGARGMTLFRDLVSAD